MNEMVFCDFCGGDVTFLGQLGNLIWFRCQDCGLEFHIEAEA